MIEAAEYGKALLELALQEQKDEKIKEELAVVCAAVEQERGYVTLLDTPAVPIEEKLTLVKGAFSKADPLLLNFLCLLCEKRAFYALPACAAAYDKHYDEAHDILRATAFTAVKMDDRQCAALQKKLALLTGKQVILKNELDPGLIGGITLRYGGTQLTDSIRSRLDKLHRSLSDTII